MIKKTMPPDFREIARIVSAPQMLRHLGWRVPRNTWRYGHDGEDRGRRAPASHGCAVILRDKKTTVRNQAVQLSLPALEKVGETHQLLQSIGTHLFYEYRSDLLPIITNLTHKRLVAKTDGHSEMEGVA